MREADGDVDIVVRDDGQGFDGYAAASSGGFGLLGMCERIALAGGTLTVASAPGEGAEIGAGLPGRRRSAVPEPSAGGSRAASAS